MKIKGLTTWTVGILMITTLLSITVNFTSRSHYKAIDQLDVYISDVTTYYVESDFSLKVLDNIEYQLPVEDPDKELNLRDAYERNMAELIQFSSDAVNELRNMETVVDEFNNLFEFVIDSEGVSRSIENVQEDYKHFNAVIESDLLREEWTVKDVLIQYNNLLSEIEGLQDAYKTYVYDLRGVLILINTGTTFVTLFLLAILSFIIFLFLFNDLPYIIESFKQLEKKNYSRHSRKRSYLMFDEQREIYHLVENIFHEEGTTTAFKDQVMSTYMMDEIIDKLYDRVNDIMSIQRIGIAFVDYSTEKIMAEYGVLNNDNIQLGPGFQVDFERTSLSELLVSKESIINNDIETYYKHHNRSGALNLIMKEGLKANMIVPLLSRDTVYGFLFFSSDQKNYFTPDHLKSVNKLAYEITGFLNRAYLTKVILSKITASFAELVDRKDNETGGHILRMVSYSVIIAKSLSQMNLEGYPVDKQMILDIQRNAATHDIGKVGIPDNVLKKPGKLDAAEWEIMKTHAAEGGDIFKNIRKGMTMFDHDFYAVAEDIARYHHEKFDGSGYPEGLKGESIPLVARIVALADVFDALTSVRVYKKAFTFEQAHEMIRDGRGSQFDPAVVDAFEQSLDDIRRVYIQENEFETL